MASGHSPNELSRGITENLAFIVLRSFALGLLLLAVSIYTFTYEGQPAKPHPKWPMYTRMFLTPFAIWAFLDTCYGHFHVTTDAPIGVGRKNLDFAFCVVDGLFTS